MTLSRRLHARITLSALLLLLGSACASPEAYQRALDDREAEIAALREERADLKRQRQQLAAQVSDLEAQLGATRAQLQARPEPIPASAPAMQSSPELERLGIGYEQRGGEAVITIPAGITFPSGSAALSKEGRAALREVATVLLRDHPDGTYRIEGHTDSDPVRKSGFANNRELSIARAMAVLTFLVEECGIPDDRCVVSGFGPHRPLDPGTSAAAKAKNRRVEIVVEDRRR